MYSGKVCLLVVVAAAALRAGMPGAAAAAIEQGRITIEQGRILQSQGRFHEAEHEFQLAVRAAGEPERQAEALSNLASTEIDLVRFDEAARLYERAIAILIKRRGEDDPRLRNLRIQLAELYLEANQTAIAEKTLRPVIAQQQTDREGAIALDVLACVYARKKKLAAAESAERRALSILETLAGPDRADFAIAILHIAGFLDLLKRTEDALPFATRALAMMKSLTVPQPAMEAAAEISLASIYSRLHRTDEAEAASEAAYRIAVEFYGPEHPKTGEILLAQAAVLRTIGQKQAARQAQANGEAIFARNSAARAMETVPVQALLP